MLTADALAVIGQGVAICVFVALVLAGGVDAALAGVTAGVVVIAVLAGRRRLSRGLALAGLWRASVVADGLAAVGTFAVILHQDARADHPLVLVLGVAATGVALAAQLRLGPRTSVRLTGRAGMDSDSLGRRWPRRRRRLQLVGLAAAALATALIGPEVGWVAFACFIQAAEAVVVLVPYAR